MGAVYYVGDAIEVMGKLPKKSVDLVLTSPPFLALRSYLPADHPDKALEGGSQATPGAYIDWLVDVVEACARVLAPHGSLCFELGDTYAGSGGAGGDYAEGHFRDGQEVYTGSAGRTRTGKFVNDKYEEANKHPGANPIPSRRPSIIPQHGSGWPLAKSLSLIPELFRLTLVYGQNPLTGRHTERWRLRNVIRWVRPNPPVGALGDKFRPATSELMVFCKSAKRFFDLDSVRGDFARDYRSEKEEHPKRRAKTDGGWATLDDWNPATSAGAPPLDWWNIPLTQGSETTRPSADDGIVIEPYEHEGRRFWPVWAHLPELGAGGISTEQLDALLSAFKTERAGPETNVPAPPLDWWNIPPGGYEGAHYAVWPPELCVKPIKAMSPEKVCRQCGEPSRRIVSTANATDERQALADYLRSQREAAGVSVKELAAHFPSVSGGMTGCVWNWENAANVPTAEQWPILKGLLTLDDRFDVLVTGERTWTESEIEYEYVNNDRAGLTQDVSGKIYRRLTSRQNRIAPDRFSDCGHNNWRPGLILDPFAGSGTTLAVATGHGRDAIGIDLDARNYDLALQRVGPFLLELAEM